MIYAIYNKDTNIIREVIESTDNELVLSLLQNNEHYQQYNDFQGHTGIDKRRLDHTGMFTSLEEQISNKLVPIEELSMMEADYYLEMQHKFDNNLPYVKEKKILNLIQQGMIALRETPKHPSEPQEPIIEEVPELPQENTPTEDLPPTQEPDSMPENQDLPPKEKTITDIINDKEREIYSLKDQYLDADLDDNEELKLDLKTQIKQIKAEITKLNDLAQ